MGDNDSQEQNQEGQQGEPKHVPREKFEDLLASVKRLEDENKGFRTEKLFRDAKLDWLNPEQLTAVKAVAGTGEWTPELLAEAAGKLGFKKQEETSQEGQGQGTPNPAPLPPGYSPNDPGLNVIERINAASDLRAPTPGNPTSQAAEFNSKLRNAKTQEEAMAIIHQEGSKFGILADYDIE